MSRLMSIVKYSDIMGENKKFQSITPDEHHI